MIVNNNSVKFLNEYMTFHHKEHYELCKVLIEKIAGNLDFKLNIKKASIHLLKHKSFAVIGFRRSRKNIFIEFYSMTYIEDPNIMEAYKAKNNLIVNRIYLEDEREFCDGLIDYLISSTTKSIKSLIIGEIHLFLCVAIWIVKFRGSLSHVKILISLFSKSDFTLI